ncbi:MAG: nicotinamide mononucleotide transporter [Sphingomonas sp.]|uniref:nicotinamide riboside transporter PnuC n=1 Tax=Sphingomonas sp. TaxID=28214 RepID=UPI001B277D29|nr:nicotinamide riboside transporter PnuC [Sphingomonas sp.]MBO9623421.1 nicotinamide mononucleotide transporter [Sphingomonas sp.]
MTAIEGAGVIAVILNLILIERRSLWNYAFGILASALYLFVFYQAKLYSGALLQLILIGLQIWGWYDWRNAREAESGEVPVDNMGNRARVLWLCGIVLGSLLWGSAVAVLTDASFPLADALLSGLSIATQALVSQRRVEGLLLWVVVNLGAIALFAAQGLYATMGLYFVLLGLSLHALRSWVRARHTSVIAVP